MNSLKVRIPDERKASEEAEATLRLLAHLPAPNGLENRVKAALSAAPRTGRVLPWPAGSSIASGKLRGVAAAAIVVIVAGGGWGVYSHVQPAQAPQAAVVPLVASPSGFSSAGAVRTPQTLQGPVLKHPTPSAQASEPAQAPEAERPGNGKRKFAHEQRKHDLSPTPKAAHP